MCFGHQKGTEQGEGDAVTAQPSPSFGSPLSPTPRLRSSLVVGSQQRLNLTEGLKEKQRFPEWSFRGGVSM